MWTAIYNLSFLCINIHKSELFKESILKNTFFSDNDHCYPSRLEMNNKICR